MAIVMQPAARFGAFLTALLLATSGPAVAAGGPEGYRGADFGMSYEDVMAELGSDEAVVKLAVDETEEGDRLIDGQLLAEEEPETDLRYVFPAGSDELALVVTFHPEVEDRETVVERLKARHGEPWEAEMADWWFEQLKAGMPASPESLMVWGGDGDEGQQRGRFVRLWTFDDYLSVEYLDTQRFE